MPIQNAVTQTDLNTRKPTLLSGSHVQTFDHDIDPGKYEFERSVPEDAFDHDSISALVLRPGYLGLFDENAVQPSGPNQTPQPRAGLTPHAGVPFVRVTGNPRGAGRERGRHVPDDLREVAMLRGRDDTGRQRVVSLPCSEH